MAFDRKAWDAANREKNKLYAVRSRLKKKGLDLPPETIAEMEAQRAAKKIASKERERERKRKWAADNKEKKNIRYRERYHSDPEFRAREIAKRTKLAKYTPEEKAAKQEAAKAERLRLREIERESRLRDKQEKALKAKKAANAKRHAKEVARGERIAPKRNLAQPVVRVSTSRKPGRLVALSGWMGW